MYTQHILKKKSPLNKMYRLKSIVSRSAAIASKQQLSKFVPITFLPSRNYAEHQIPERLRDVATAKGYISIHNFLYLKIFSH